MVPQSWGVRRIIRVLLFARAPVHVAEAHAQGKQLLCLGFQGKELLVEEAAHRAQANLVLQLHPAQLHACVGLALRLAACVALALLAKGTISQ